MEHEPPAAPPPEPLPERKPASRLAAFVAMGVVAFAIILLMMLAPGGFDPDAPPPGTTAQPAAGGANTAPGETATPAELQGDAPLILPSVDAQAVASVVAALM